MPMPGPPISPPPTPFTFLPIIPFLLLESLRLLMGSLEHCLDQGPPHYV